jgi:hypothetical protein
MKNISMGAWLKQNEDRKGHYAGIRRSRGVSIGKDQGEDIMKYLRKDNQIFYF